MKNLKKYIAKTLLASAALLVSAAPAWAQVDLGTASDFSVLGGTNVTCTSGVVTGDVGVAPGGAVPYTNTGCIISGAVPPATDAAAVLARSDFLSAYDAIQTMPCSGTLLSTISGPLTLAPGVYCTGAALTATDVVLTLDANNDPNAEWVFLVNGALTGTNFTVTMANGGQPCNVYWAPAAAVTMTASAFKGNILAGNAIGGSVTLTGGSLAGSVLANVAVTMTGASVIGCDSLAPPSPSCKPHKHHDKDHHDKDHHDKDRHKCNQGVGNGSEGCDPGNSNNHHSSNDENGGKPGYPGRKDRK